MGNTSSSKERHSGDETVDFGTLFPQGGIYPSANQDWNHSVVAQLIVQRKLAPFYRPLEDYEDDWDDEQIIAARRDPVLISQSANSSSTGIDDPNNINPSSSSQPGPSSGSSIISHHSHQHKDSASSSHHHSLHLPGAPLQSATSALRHAAGAASGSGGSANSKSAIRSSSAQKEPQPNLEAQLYRGAVECPICFLYYPPNINQTRCCDQAICSECFVHIKRADPTTTHLVSEPACCPYCMQSNFGILYSPPTWRAGIGSEGASSSRPDFFTHSSSNSTVSNNSTEMGVAEGKRRRKSVSHTSQDVVTIDQIRPDWEQKLNAVRAAVARRANRRIVMRQVGDQLIPVGITSGRVVALPPGTEGAVIINESTTAGSGRRRRRDRNGGDNGGTVIPGDSLGQFLGQMGVGTQDIEELMIMEAMRLSMVEENERQRRQREQEQNGASSGAQASTSNAESNDPAPLSSSHPPPNTIADRLQSSQQGPLLSSSLPTSSLLSSRNISPARVEEAAQPPSSSTSSLHSSSSYPAPLPPISTSRFSTDSNSTAIESAPRTSTSSFFDPAGSVPPTATALGAAGASIALAVGGSRMSPPSPRPGSGASALSAMLGATTNTATAVLGSGSRGASPQRPIPPIPTQVQAQPQPQESRAVERSGLGVAHDEDEDENGGHGARTPVAGRSSSPTASSTNMSIPLPAPHEVLSSSQGGTGAPITSPTAHLQSGPLTAQTLMTPWSVNSEAAEGYDWLPGSPHSSALSDSARERLIEEEDEEEDEGEEEEDPLRPRGSLGSGLEDESMTSGKDRESAKLGEFSEAVDVEDEGVAESSSAVNNVVQPVA